MKRLLAIFGLVLGMTGPLYAVQPDGGPANIAGTLYASNFAGWSVPQGNNGPFSWSSSQICTSATSGGVSFQPFVVGSPIRLVDTAVPANSEIVVPTAVNITGSGCTVTINPARQHYSFYLTTATAGLQEAINYSNQSLGAAVPASVVILTPAWSQIGGTTSMITSALGNTRVTLVDQRTSISAPYIWNGTQYVFTPYGGGANPAPPQYAVQYAGPSATTFNADPTFSFNTSTHGLSALLTNGGYSTDVAQSGGGNNGLGNLEAGACSAGGCTPMFPATSTSAESPVPTVTNTHVQDYRGGSQGDFFYNSDPLGAGGFVFSGDRPSNTKALVASWTASTINGLSQNQLAETYNLNFNGPGWNWGSNPASTHSNWSTQKAINFTMNVSTPGIAELMGGQLTKTGNGDSAALGYFYSHIDGGVQAPADEGNIGVGLQVLQNNTWFIGRAGTGATTGTQSLPTTWTNTTNSRPQYTVGGYMLDISRPILSNAHVTGPSTEVGSLYAWAFPVDATVTESTAWGTANAVIPQPATPGTAQSDTVSFTVIGGTNAGGYTTGKAWMNGAFLQEQVMITAVGTISGGVQSVTFTHRYGNSQANTSLWQGGTNGFYASSEIINTLNGWTTAYTIIGATDSSHLVGRFSQSGSNAPIPSFYSAQTANVPVQNLSISGTTVTANIGGTSGNFFNHLTQISISNATNSSFIGAGSAVTVLNNNTIQWTQTGPSGTSASALISYPQTYFAFNLFPGAQVTQPTLTTTVPLESNDVPWTPNDIIYNVFYPVYRGALITGLNQINNPDTQSTAGVGGMGASFVGAGISGQYTFLGFSNGNSATMYAGDGGFLLPPTAINIQGPTGTVLKVQNGPLNGQPLISVGCPNDGCGSTNDEILLAATGSSAGTFSFSPAGNYFFLTALRTASLRASVVSTGTGIYVNGGRTGLPAAMTSPSSVTGNNMTSLGTYAAFGNETPMDTSATVAAKVFAAGTVIAGALPPGGTPTVITDNSGGTTSYSYVCTSNTQNGESFPSAPGTTALGQAVLSSSHPNTIQCPVGVGSQSTNVYRSAVTGSYGIGEVCDHVPNNTIDNSSSFGCQDIGQAAGKAIPTADTTGSIILPGASGCAYFTAGVMNWTGSACGSGGSMTWPAAAGIPNYSGSSSWSTSYSATNHIPANFISTLNQSTTGNAATATALASTPSLCSTGQAPTGVLANGNATGCAALATGSVTAVSIAAANGISGTSSGGATPALTLALGAITPSQVTVTGSGIPIASGVSTNTDLDGRLTMVSGTKTYTFTATYTTAPVCVASDTTAANSVQASASTTVLTINGTGTDVINYICMGLN